MITNRFQIIEMTKEGNRSKIRGMVFKYYDGAMKAAGRLARIHPDLVYIIADKQNNTEYQINQV